MQIDAAELVARIADRLVARHETLAVAESAAGGLLCHLLTNLPGSSAWLSGGVVAYSNASKRIFLGVDESVIGSAGAVSAEVALAMAHGVREATASTWGLAETGIAGPQTGRRSAKPAGFAYLAIVGGPEHRPVAIVRTVQSESNDRLVNKQAFAVAALDLAIDAIEAHV